MDDSYAATIVTLIVCSAVFAGVAIATVLRCCYACKQTLLLKENDEENAHSTCNTLQEIIVDDEKVASWNLTSSISLEDVPGTSNAVKLEYSASPHWNLI